MPAKYQPNSKRFAFWKKIYATVKAEPGINKPLLAEKIGANPKTIDGVLCGMENEGLLLSEDDKGRLYIYDSEL